MFKKLNNNRVIKIKNIIKNKTTNIFIINKNARGYFFKKIFFDK